MRKTRKSRNLPRPLFSISMIPILACLLCSGYRTPLFLDEPIAHNPSSEACPDLMSSFCQPSDPTSDSLQQAPYIAPLCGESSSALRYDPFAPQGPLYFSTNLGGDCYVDSAALGTEAQSCGEIPYTSDPGYLCPHQKGKGRLDTSFPDYYCIECLGIT